MTTPRYVHTVSRVTIVKIILTKTARIYIANIDQANISNTYHHVIYFLINSARCPIPGHVDYKVSQFRGLV